MLTHGKEDDGRCLFGLMCVGQSPILIPNLKNEQCNKNNIYQITLNDIPPVPITLVIYFLPHVCFPLSSIACVYINEKNGASPVCSNVEEEDDDDDDWIYKGYLSMVEHENHKSLLIPLFSGVKTSSITVRLMVVSNGLFHIFQEEKDIEQELYGKMNRLHLLNTICDYMHHRKEVNIEKMEHIQRLQPVSDALDRANKDLYTACMHVRALARSSQIEIDELCSEFIKHSPPPAGDSPRLNDLLLQWSHRELMRTKECLFVPFMRLNRLLCAVATYHHHRLQETCSTHNREQHKDKWLQVQKQTREETKRRMKTMRLMIGVFESIQDKSLDRVQGNLSQEQLNRRRQLNNEIKQCLEQLQLEMERSKCTLSAM
jgi:hypothetical protein